MHNYYTVLLEQKRSIGEGVVVMQHVRGDNDINAGDDARNALAYPQHWNVISVKEES